MNDEAYESLAALGKVSFLLAPNHYHNKGLAEYAEAFPDAKLICSEHARPRLEKQTRMTFKPLSTIAPLLLDGCNMTEPEGLKTGEVWLTHETPNNHIWIVCDAFTGSKTKAGGISKKVELLGTFPTYGINDHQTYKTWVDEKLNTHPPATIVPCHGPIVQNESLVSDIKSLLGQ